MFEPLFTPLFSPLFSSLFAAAQRVFITLDAAQEGHCTLENPVVETGDFSHSFEFSCGTQPTFTVLGDSTGFSNHTNVLPAEIEVRIDGTRLHFTGAFQDNKLHEGIVIRAGSVVEIIVDDVTIPEDTLTGSSGTLTYNVLGQENNSDFSDGIIANPDLGNGNAWPLDVLTGNTQQAVNGNNELTLVNIPTGAPDRELFTKNTTTTPNQWENADKSRIIQVA